MPHRFALARFRFRGLHRWRLSTPPSHGETLSLRRHRLTQTLAAITGVAVLLVACEPTSPPPARRAVLPTPASLVTSIASPSDVPEATASLHQYVSAASESDLTQPSTFDAVFESIAGDLLEHETRFYTELHAAGWKQSGSSLVTYVSHFDTDPAPGVIVLDACVDSSGMTMRNAEGGLMVPDNGYKMMAFDVHFSVQADGSWKPDRITQREGKPDCLTPGEQQ